jgi:3-phosphoglycerate kinase
MSKQTIKDVDVKGKRVLVRVDFNVPLTSDGEVRDDYRIYAVIPTINYLVENGAKVILMSHLGRPNGLVKPELKMDPVAKVLSNLLQKQVRKLDDCVGEEVKKAIDAMQPGDIVLLENLRFHKGEEDNDPEFAKELASLGDVYVDDAFATAHRDAASNVGITEYLPSVAGLLMDKEVTSLSKLLEAPERPFVAILGGAKVSDKINLIENLMKRVDTFLIGGGMCFTFLKAKGYKIGYSLCEDDKLSLANDILTKARDNHVRFILPIDVVVSPEVKDSASSKIVDIEEFPDGEIGVDIGPKTIKLFENELSKAKTIAWNGPLGVFEIEKFAQGTLEIAKYLGSLNNVTTVAGGGDTVAAFRKFGLEDKVTNISTGGGAFLEFLEGKTLPGVDALSDK